MYPAWPPGSRERHGIVGTEASRPPQWDLDPTTAWTRAEDEAVAVLEMATGVPLRLSPSASVIWEILVRDRTPQDELACAPLSAVAEDALVDEVAAAFDEAPETVAPGVTAFLTMLAERGILIPHRSAPHPGEDTR